MTELTAQDQKIYNYLRQYDADAGPPAPSYREIVNGCGLKSTRLIGQSLSNLKAAGLISWYPGIARSIRVIGNGAGEGR